MLRNKEFRHMLFFMVVISSSICFLALALPFWKGLLLVLAVLLLDSVFLFYTVHRYQDLRRLTGYLHRISGGEYSLDIRDNKEGELSILKNELYKMTLLLSRQAELLKNEKEQLADAISDISHQLKTPLTSMRVMTDLLREEKLEPERRKEFTRSLKQQLDRMEWLLTSLLKLAKIDAGTVHFKKEVLSVKELINRAVKPLLIPMELKEQTLELDGSEELTLTGDRNWTAEALINILKNCTEHTQTGGTITVKWEDNPIYTEIKISDNGCGIAKEDLPFLFKRFYKGKNAGEESVGIGLAMAKSIIAGQNGDIAVASKLGEGTSFSIKFHKLHSEF